jgi:hypothetical protein
MRTVRTLNAERIARVTPQTFAMFGVRLKRLLADASALYNC